MDFLDVSEDAWYYEAVDFVFYNGLMNGLSDSQFAPEDTTTRAMMVQVIYNIMGRPENRPLPEPFEDVAWDAWYAEAIKWAKWNGLVEGVSETHFAPNAPVTREQMVTMFYRFANALGMDTTARADLSAYTDGNRVSDWADDAMGWAVNAGIINGMTETTLVPQGNSTRAQIATVLQRFVLWLEANS